MYRLLYGFLLGLTVASATAQTVPTGLSVTYPSSRAVFQRENDNTSTIYLSGTYFQPVDSIQARLVVEVNGQGLNTNWTTIRRNPQGGVFQGAINGTGGWYRLEVQGFQGGRVIAQDVVRKVGIGEVFIITGQSNAQGFLEYSSIGASDDRVNCVSYDNREAHSLADPPAPTFEQLSAQSIIGPRGYGAWCWGRLGDLLAQQYNIPILFINTAWGGSTIQNWIESFDDGFTKSVYFDGFFPKGMPYANLRIALRYYASLQGLRAILWHQGESDNLQNSNTVRATYKRQMEQLVAKTRTDTQRYPAWMLARASRNSDPDPTCFAQCNGNADCINRCPRIFRTNDQVTGGQTDVINTFSNNVYAGPFTDPIQPNRLDGVHFQGDGLIQLANAWYQSMSPTFFAAALPLLPQPQPTVTVECVNNNSVTLRLPSTGFQSYLWSNGQTGSTITVSQPGQYQAKLKNAIGNTFLSPTVNIQLPIQPATPTISLARNGTAVADAQQQICADSVLTLVANVGTQSSAQWNNGINNTVLRVANAGQYNVQAVNTYGCRSNTSSAISLTVRPRLATPTIEQVGIYSIQATLPGFPNNEQFDWRRGSIFLNNQNGPVAKALISGTYTARAKALFTLSNGNTLTCYSGFSNEVLFTSSESAQIVSIYPNPSTNGYIAVETIEDLQNADLTIQSITGQVIYSEKIPSFNARRLIPVANFASGQYIVRVRSEGFDVARRVFITR